MNDQVLNSPTVEYPLVVLHHPPWNKNRIIGRKVPFKLREICTIRAYLDYDHNLRDSALLDIAIDSKLRGCDVTRLRVEDVCHGEHMLSRASVRQSKTRHAVTFEITPLTRKSVSAWIKGAGLKQSDHLFPSRAREDGHFDKHTYALLARELAKSPRERILYLITRVDWDQRITADGERSRARASAIR